MMQTSSPADSQGGGGECSTMFVYSCLIGWNRWKGGETLLFYTTSCFYMSLRQGPGSARIRIIFASPKTWLTSKEHKFRSSIYFIYIYEWDPDPDQDGQDQDGPDQDGPDQDGPTPLHWFSLSSWQQKYFSCIYPLFFSSCFHSCLDTMNCRYSNYKYL